MTILPDLVIEQVRMSKEVTITVRAAYPTAPCPCCGITAKRISRHMRTLRDLPVSGHPPYFSKLTLILFHRFLASDLVTSHERKN